MSGPFPAELLREFIANLGQADLVAFASIIGQVEVKPTWELVIRLKGSLASMKIEDLAIGSFDDSSFFYNQLPHLRSLSLQVRYVKPDKRNSWPRFFPCMPNLEELHLDLTQTQVYPTIQGDNGLEFQTSFLNSLTQYRPSTLRKLVILFREPFLAHLLQDLCPLSASEPLHTEVSFHVYNADPTVAGHPGIPSADS